MPEKRILTIAKLVFTRHEAEATLDDIARQAVIGPGALHLTFPPETL